MGTYENGLDILEALDHIDPSGLDYQDWVNVGMALKEAGYGPEVWEDWSRRDGGRYHPGECQRKWNTFRGASMGESVGPGTIVKMAMDRGWRPTPTRDDRPGLALEWDDAIGGKDDGMVVDRAWMEGLEVHEPVNWKPVDDLITYLSTLFDPSEYVGYVINTFDTPDGGKVPSRGNYDRTAGQLIDALRACKGDIGSVLGDSDPEIGAWVRFNPLDGKGVKDQNVTSYRYALVESDTMSLEDQHAMIRELELPVAALVSSGGKSLHAIVHIDATSFEEYRTRVDYLYAICEKNGLTMDRQNRNPSRLSRLPGVTRKGHKQFLLGTNLGKASWQEWREWVDAVTDDLPDLETMADVWGDLPELSKPLIHGVLRQGHKMLLAGPSKAGKSYALIELCCAIAEGRPWLGFSCAQGRVLYVNLELDRASCLHRFKDVYEALGYPPNHLDRIDVWNLRGRSVPMDKLAPKLIRRAMKKDYIAIVIDPIYKVITGDENSADQMANFCNQFDKVCNELGCAVVYCHHHSKGQQGGKRSMDRASGSGVFARDPDALLDLIELPVSDDLRKQEVNKAVGKAVARTLEKAGKLAEASQDALCTEKGALEAARGLLSAREYQNLVPVVEAARKAGETATAWRIEGTLREFPKFPPVNLWFDYPVHRGDISGVLADVDPEQDTPAWQRHRKSPEAKKQERKGSVEAAFEACGIDGEVEVSAMAEYMGTSEKTVRRRLKEHGGFWVDEGKVGRRTQGQS